MSRTMRLIGHLLIWGNIIAFISDVVLAMNHHSTIKWLMALLNLSAAIVVATVFDLLD